MLLVGFCFVAFERRINALTGRCTRTLGIRLARRWGFAAGWAILFYYSIVFQHAPLCSVMEFPLLLREFGVHQPDWLLLAIGLLLNYRMVDMEGHQNTARGMLARGRNFHSQLFWILVIRILTTVPLSFFGSPCTPMQPMDGQGIGYGMVFCDLLAFGGFEGAAILGHETCNPRRNIPIAIIGTLVFPGLFYVFVVYAQIDWVWRQQHKRSSALRHSVRLRKDSYLANIPYASICRLSSAPSLVRSVLSVLRHACCAS